MKMTPNKVIATTLICVTVFGFVVMLNSEDSANDTYQRYLSGRAHSDTRVSAETIISMVDNTAESDQSASPDSTTPTIPGVAPDSTAQGVAGTTTDHGHIMFKQGNYHDVISNGKTISGSGCGWCSLSAMMSNLNTEKCGSMTPVDWLGIIPDDVKSLWNSGKMDWSAPEAWVNAINANGQYGTYSVVSKLEGTSSSACMDLIRQYAGQANTMILVSSSPGLFTSGGHILCIACKFEENGVKYFHTIDSSNRASNNLGQTWPYSNTVSMPLDSDNLNGKPYNLKCVWVIQKV